MSEQRPKILIIDDGNPKIPHIAFDMFNRYGAQVIRVTPDNIHELDTKTLIELEPVSGLTNKLTTPKGEI